MSASAALISVGAACAAAAAAAPWTPPAHAACAIRAAAAAVRLWLFLSLAFSIAGSSFLRCLRRYFVFQRLCAAAQRARLAGERRRYHIRRAHTRADVQPGRRIRPLRSSFPPCRGNGRTAVCRRNIRLHLCRWLCLYLWRCSWCYIWPICGRDLWSRLCRRLMRRRGRHPRRHPGRHLPSDRCSLLSCRRDRTSGNRTHCLRRRVPGW